MHEFLRPDDVAGNPVALASITDLLITLALRAAPHNYSDRLEQARRELIRGEAGATVATVARRHGFTNPARFTVAFRRRFGENPAEALKSARSNGARRQR